MGGCAQRPTKTGNQTKAPQPVARSTCCAFSTSSSTPRPFRYRSVVHLICCRVEFAGWRQWGGGGSGNGGSKKGWRRDGAGVPHVRDGVLNMARAHAPDSAHLGHNPPLPACLRRATPPSLPHSKLRHSEFEDLDPQHWALPQHAATAAGPCHHPLQPRAAWPVDLMQLHSENTATQ